MSSVTFPIDVIDQEFQYFILRLHSCWKLFKTAYSESFSSRREFAAHRDLCAFLCQHPVARFIVELFAAPLRLGRKLKPGSVGVSMSMYLVCSLDLYSDVFGRKSTRIRFREVTKHIITVENEVPLKKVPTRTGPNVPST